MMDAFEVLLNLDDIVYHHHAFFTIPDGKEKEIEIAGSCRFIKLAIIMKHTVSIMAHFIMTCVYIQYAKIHL